MGATESKLAFRKNVFQLYEQQNIPASNDEYWSNFYKLPETAEDVFNLFSPKDIRKVRDTAVGNLETLLHKVINRIFGFLKLSAIPSKAEANEIANCVRILTRLLPYVFEVEDGQLEERLFWQVPTTSSSTDEENKELGTESLGIQLTKAVVQLLFFRGFTLPEGQDPNSAHGVQYMIWQHGVGASVQVSSTRENISHRTDTLRLLLTLISRSIYCPPQKILEFDNRWGTAIACRLEKKQVLTLLCSLLNTTVNYDPVGWALLPYNHLLISDAQEQLVTLCLQTLTALLDLRPVPSSDAHGQSANTYLPGSTKRVNIFIEALMLFWKLLEHNDKFAHQAMETDKILIIFAAVIYFALEARSDPAQIGLLRMCCFIIHIMSQDRNFAVQLNSPFHYASVGAAAKAVPTFGGGTWADYFFLAVHSLVTTPSRASMLHLHEHLLTSLTNVSPYVKSLNITATTKMISLFTIYSNPAFMLANEHNHKNVFFLLEIFNNILQYQVTGNTHLVYAVVRNKDKFMNLHNLTYEHAFSELTRIRALRAQKQQQQAGTQPPATPTTPTPPAEPKSSQSSESLVENLTRNMSKTSLTSGEDVHPTDPEQDNSESSPVDGSDAEPSEKAKGKRPAAGNGEAQTRAPGPSFDEKGKFMPNQEWFNYWRAHLPLSVILTLIDALAPTIEQLCVDQAINDDRKVLEFLQSGTLVGLLPVPHPIYIRRFHYAEGMRIWFTSYLWGCVFTKSNGMGAGEAAKLCPPIWTGTHIRLFLVKISM
ncbi:high-temperature-induced dauer-formation protein-domain-containing protein [Phlyctochytrium arcticum]|nr:high-temperature-induced dauer-formation protein-domain-containing protein [Phlyctochytrium arcticum]